MNAPSIVVGKFAPTGKLRASINLGNPVLAGRDPESGSPVGVSIDLAANFAERLGVEIEFVLFDSVDRRVLPGPATLENPKAMGLPRGRGVEAAAILAKYVEEMKTSGFVAQALSRHGIRGASVAGTGEGPAASKEIEGAD